MFGKLGRIGRAAVVVSVLWILLVLVVALMTNQSWYDRKLDFVGFLEGFVGFGIIPVVLGWESAGRLRLSLCHTPCNLAP